MQGEGCPGKGTAMEPPGLRSLGRGLGGKVKGSLSPGPWSDSLTADRLTGHSLQRAAALARRPSPSSGHSATLSP